MDKYKVDIDETKAIVYVYIKNFEWHNDKDRQLLHDHPESGRVYRAIKTHNGIYQIKIDAAGEEINDILGVMVQSKDDSHSNFTSSIEELNESNIVDFDIHEDDYRKLGKWMEADDDGNNIGNKDFIDLIWKLEHPEDQYINIHLDMLPEEFRNQVKSIIDETSSDYMKTATTGLSKLVSQDPLSVDVLSDYILYMNDRISKEDPKLLKMSSEIALHEDYGRGANIYSILYNIENYSHSNDTIGHKEIDLYKAMDAILLELTRLKLYKKNG